MYMLKICHALKILRKYCHSSHLLSAFVCFYISQPGTKIQSNKMSSKTVEEHAFVGLGTSHQSEYTTLYLYLCVS